ncbi:hypothetical protein KAR91_75225 [Candidatus Pacearchaeota archaeon]|nr:hypothetical protein [Candidatus Pacearchaeota archaeon]
MALTEEIIDFVVKDNGEQFAGLMHSISAKLILKEGETVVHEQVFTEKHKHIYIISETMEKMAVKMAAVKKRIETEGNLKIEAEAEKTKMLDKITSIKEVK